MKINRSKRVLLFLVFSLLASPAISFALHSYSTGGWDYYGSGRDHAYSAYIDRKNYVGPADYAPIPVDYMDGPLVSAPMPAPVEAFPVNIPNVHGGYNVVVIKRSGDGFMGPNGEYYPEFPKVFQLQMKYGN